MNKRLPTIYHGVPDPGEDTSVVNDAIQDVVARLNEVPMHLLPRVICSVVLSLCCAQHDPVRAFHEIGNNVRHGLNDVLATEKEAGNA